MLVRNWVLGKSYQVSDFGRAQANVVGCAIGCKNGSVALV